MPAAKDRVQLEVIRPITVRDAQGNVVRHMAAGLRAQCLRDCGHYWETDQGRLYKYEARIVGRAFKIGAH